MTEHSKTVVLDVREDIRQGGEPFERIMTAVHALHGDQELELWAPFEPQPLFGAMSGLGFEHEAEAQPHGDWRVRFFRARAQA
ncbi:MAG: DUF2249 domain-containing protein [Chloroflexota bacterium]